MESLLRCPGENRCVNKSTSLADSMDVHINTMQRQRTKTVNKLAAAALVNDSLNLRQHALALCDESPTEASDCGQSCGH